MMGVQLIEMQLEQNIENPDEADAELAWLRETLRAQYAVIQSNLEAYVATCTRTDANNDAQRLQVKQINKCKAKVEANATA